jgi:hypothetical protein
VFDVCNHIQQYRLNRTGKKLVEAKKNALYLRSCVKFSVFTTKRSERKNFVRSRSEYKVNQYKQEKEKEKEEEHDRHLNQS